MGALDGGGYVQASPGIVGLTFAESKYAGLSWPWSIGGGRMWAGDSGFKVTLGAALEHHVMFIAGGEFEVGAHSVHMLVESRIGGGNERVWGYALVGVGPSVTIFPGRLLGVTTTHGGLDAQVGAGIQGLVAGNFFLGAELDADFNIYFPSFLTLFLNDRTRFYQSGAIKLVLGGYF